MKDTTKGFINNSDMQKTLERDDLFYDEYVVFKVENTLFSVPKKGLVQPGTFFETLFQEKSASSEVELDQDNASDDATVAEQKWGSSDENPIVLEGVKKEEFRDFLRVIYPHNAAGPYEDDEWINVLHLAHKWNFPSIKEQAVDKIDHLFVFEEYDVLEALSLCRKYDIQSWLITMYARLVTQDVALDRKKMLNSGLDEETISIVYVLRDHWLTQCIHEGDHAFDNEGDGAKEFIQNFLAAQKSSNVDSGGEVATGAAPGDKKQGSWKTVKPSSQAPQDEHKDTQKGDKMTLAERIAVPEDGETVSARVEGCNDDVDEEDSDEGGEVESQTSEDTIDPFDEEDKHFQDRNRTRALALHELFSEFKQLLKYTVKKNAPINLDDVLFCIKRYVKGHDSVSDALEHVAETLFEKALVDPTCSDLYADLCDDLSDSFDSMTIADPYHAIRSPIRAGKFFIRQLYRLWYKAFNDRGIDVEKNIMCRPKFLRAKQRRLALIKFMGELFLSNQIYGHSMGRYVERMIHNIVEYQDELDVKSLCYLLSLIGARFDCGGARPYTRVYFDTMKELAQVRAIPQRLRNMIEEVLELRDRDWEAPPPMLRKWLPLR